MTRELTDYQARIVTDPAIMVGKPVVRGTRIPVYIVLGHLAEDLDLDELFAAYPELTREDVNACLAYAAALLERQRPKKPTPSLEASYQSVPALSPRRTWHEVTEIAADEHAQKAGRVRPR